MGYVWTGGQKGNKADTCGQDIEEKEKSFVLLLTFRALK